MLYYLSMETSSPSALTRLECPECGRFYDAFQIQTICASCNSPLMARYDLERLKTADFRQAAAERPNNLWRWAELLPVQDPPTRLTLGEGGSPMLPIQRFAGGQKYARLVIKDESGQPAGSFKARGMAVAVSRALELGIRDFVLPTAGNAGGALAAYTARARALGWPARAHIYMPEDAPGPFRTEAALHGADLHLVEGLISDAGRIAGRESASQGWFNMSTLREPYRLEGKKTMGYELALDAGWELPDVIIYPTGGGTGLVGMWKAFDEMQALGWIGKRRPRMVSVQAAGCAPVVKAFLNDEEDVTPWENASTLAAGLRVPAPFAGRLILRALRESRGTAVSIPDEDILQAQAELARQEGIFAAPEGAAAAVAARFLIDMNWIKPGERIVIFNTGSGLKYN